MFGPLFPFMVLATRFKLASLAPDILAFDRQPWLEQLIVYIGITLTRTGIYYLHKLGESQGAGVEAYLSIESLDKLSAMHSWLHHRLQAPISAKAQGHGHISIVQCMPQMWLMGHLLLNNKPSQPAVLQKNRSRITVRSRAIKV